MAQTVLAAQILLLGLALASCGSQGAAHSDRTLLFAARGDRAADATAAQAARCAVAGCRTCAPGNASACAVCGTRMYVNPVAGTCGCQPGTAGATACRPCARGSVSPGGPLPTAPCSACAAGTAPSKDGSECLAPSGWRHWGGDLSNRRWAASEKRLKTSNAGKLRPKWSAAVGGSTSATPTVHGGFVYIPDWDGNMYCLRADTGALVWSRTVREHLTALNATLTNRTVLSRTSPVVYQDTVIFGTMGRNLGGWAWFLALKQSNGDLVWGHEADPNPTAIITTSPTLHDGVIYGGVSSLEENAAAGSNYTCCTFRGSAIALNAATGAVLWHTHMAPSNGDQPGGWSGAAVWGSSPVVDRARGQVVVSTGDNYDMPDDVNNCLLALGNLTAANAPQQRDCMQLANGTSNFHNAIVALDMVTGAVKWATPVDGPDAWNAACLSDSQDVRDNCPAVEGPDFDFGQAPMLVTPCKGRLGCRQLLVVGQKSGVVWALDASNGALVWNRRAGPGGLIGGMMWGSASDNSLVYVANNNFGKVTLNFTAGDAYLRPVPNAPGSRSPPAAADGGLLIALDAWDGSIKWAFANPVKDFSNAAAWTLSAVTVANGVVLYASADPAGTLFALRAADGRLLGNYSLGASLACGPAVVDGVIYSGTGYENFGLGIRGTQVVALEAPR